MFLVNCTNPFEPLIKYKLKTTCYLKDDYSSKYGDVDGGGRSHSCPSSGGESHTLCAVIHVCALTFQDTPFKKITQGSMGVVKSVNEGAMWDTLPAVVLGELKKVDFKFQHRFICVED